MGLNLTQTLHFIHHHCFWVTHYPRVSPLTGLDGCPCAWYEGVCGSKVWLHQLTSALNGMKGSASRPGRFIPGETGPPRYPLNRRGVGPRTCLDALGEEVKRCPYREPHHHSLVKPLAYLLYRQSTVGN